MPWWKMSSPPSSQKGAQSGSLTIAAPSGAYPDVIPLAVSRMSGEIPNRSLANISPTRPKPVITSSTTNTMSFSRQISSTRSRYPGAGKKTPPVPITGSQMKAATVSAPRTRTSSASASASSLGIRTVSSTNGP